MLGDDVDLARFHYLGDRRQARLLAGLGQVAEALDAEPLEAVRAGAGLEGAAAEDRRAGLGNRVRRFEHHLPVLDRARAGHDREPAVADLLAEDFDDRVLGVRLPRSQLVWL